ncbi:MAG: response regulator [Parcubacteria group bacterium]
MEKNGEFEKKTVKILLAEDEATNMEILTRVLDRIGHAPEKAQNGEEAIELLREKKFDIVITDYIMPKKNGVDVICFIHENSNGNYPRIIVISGTFLDFECELFQRIPREEAIISFIQLLSKPLRITDFKAAVTSAMV